MISTNYRKEQQKLHENPKYGVAALHYAPIVAQLIRDNGFRSLHDYGAGKRRLRDALTLDVDYSASDPAFPEYGEPRPADLVCCIDVLEHVEPDHLDAVLGDLARITTKAGFFTVHTKPALKTLSDGRNAHLIQQPASWWLPRLCARLEVIHLQQSGSGFWVVVTPKSGP